MEESMTATLKSAGLKGYDMRLKKILSICNKVFLTAGIACAKAQR